MRKEGRCCNVGRMLEQVLRLYWGHLFYCCFRSQWKLYSIYYEKVQDGREILMKVCNEVTNMKV